jgi:hypothetical protein
VLTGGRPGVPSRWASRVLAIHYSFQCFGAQAGANGSVTASAGIFARVTVRPTQSSPTAPIIQICTRRGLCLNAPVGVQTEDLRAEMLTSVSHRA